jgi:hypothetical protein
VRDGRPSSRGRASRAKGRVAGSAPEVAPSRMEPRQGPYYSEVCA